jgi:hypothetical protein
MYLSNITLPKYPLSYMCTRTDITEIRGTDFYCFSFILNKDNFLCSCFTILLLYLLAKIKIIIFLRITTVQLKPEVVSSVFSYTKQNNRSGTTQFVLRFILQCMSIDE